MNALLFSGNVVNNGRGAVGARYLICEHNDMDKEVIWIAVLFGIFVVSMGTVLWMTLSPVEGAAPPEIPMRAEEGEQN